MCHRKRQRIGMSLLTSPVKAESDDSPRCIGLQPASAGQYWESYGPLGALNSQIGEATYVDNLYGVRADSDLPKIEGNLRKCKMLNISHAREAQTPVKRRNINAWHLGLILRFPMTSIYTTGSN
ncbi:hypothetical protein B0H14DRAFT_2567035 [Mycena olivaceomarginata]|nr:hypothetical protein B0H14DRAFT_2567035 [Mycena olivaceomarginata]